MFLFKKNLVFNYIGINVLYLIWVVFFFFWILRNIKWLLFYKKKKEKIIMILCWVMFFMNMYSYLDCSNYVIDILVLSFVWFIIFW